ncbi:MAG: ATP-binding protein [Candidatus Doudnabacteria bacterium]
MLNPLKSVSAKLTSILFIFILIILIVEVFSIWGINKLIKSEQNITGVQLPIAQTSSQALIALRESNLAITKTFLLQNIEQLDEVRLREAQFSKAALRFTMLNNALLYGSKSQEFEKTQGGILKNEWKLYTANNPELIIPKVTDQQTAIVKQTLEQYKTVVSKALQIFALQKKVIRLTYQNQPLSQIKSSQNEISELFVQIDNLENEITQNMNLLAEINQNTTYRLIAEQGSRSTTIQVITIIISFFGLITMLTLGLYAIKTYITNPIKLLTTNIRKVSSGDLTTHVPVVSEDELGVLAKSFNYMTDKLADSYQNLESKIAEKTKKLATEVDISDKARRTALHVMEDLREEKDKLENSKTAMMNILEDIQDEKNRFKDQVVETQKFQLAVESASDQVIISDPEGIILYTNPATEKITGFSQDEIIGKKVGTKELWGGHMSRDFYQELWRTIKIEKKVFVGEVKNKRKSQEEYISQVSISPVLDQKGEVLFFVSIERDITKEKMVDQAKTEFVSLASHQLRTPLTAIGWYTEMLLAGDAGKITKKQKEFLEEVYAGNKRMVDLVNALLNVSRLELGTIAVEPEPANIIEIAQGVISDLKAIILEKQDKIVTHFDQNIPITPLDKKLVYMIFQNLLTNAIKYSPDKSTITTSIQTDETNIKISVADQGLGIPQSQQDKIFTKLFRADNVKGTDTTGTGLGLYIIKSILDHSGGTIRFESIQNQGTTFFVTIPKSGMKKQEGSKTLNVKSNYY